MSSSNNFLLALIAFTFIISTISTSDCLHKVDGYLFNLCPFDKYCLLYISYLTIFRPISIVTHRGDVYTASFNQAQVPSCHTNSANVWLALTDEENEEVCMAASQSPIFMLNGIFHWKVSLDLLCLFRG